MNAHASDLAASIERLADEHVAIGELVTEVAARTRRRLPIGSRTKEMRERMAAFLVDVENLRCQHFPDALELVIVDNSAHLEDATGASARLVWSRGQGRP